MKNRLLIIILIILPFLCFSQSYEKIPLSGELMMGRSFEKAKAIPFQQTLKVLLYYIPPDGTGNVKIDMDELTKKEWYSDPGGTNIRFYMPYFLFDKLIKKDNFISIMGTFYYEIPFTKKLDSVSRFLSISVNTYKPKSKTSNATIDLNPILLSEPEKLTLSIMINYLNDEINSSNANSGEGFSTTVYKLDKYMDDYYDNKKVNYETLIDFYKFLVFMNEYTDKNSFFNEEAQKLNEKILTLNNQLTDTVNNNTDINKIGLINDIITSNEIYKDYLLISSKLKEYSSRIQLILFLKAK